MVNSEKILILGVGNLLLGDEGVGIHAVEQLKKDAALTGVDIVDGGTGGFHLLSYFDEYKEMILIDATMDSKPVGTVTLLKPKFASDFPTALSAHDIGLRDLIETAFITSGLPNIKLITISIKEIQQMKTSLSPEIEKAIPEVIRLVKKIVG